MKENENIGCVVLGLEGVRYVSSDLEVGRRGSEIVWEPCTKLVGG